jgi:hypothetical protein
MTFSLYLLTISKERFQVFITFKLINVIHGFFLTFLDINRRRKFHSNLLKSFFRKRRPNTKDSSAAEEIVEKGKEKKSYI